MKSLILCRNIKLLDVIAAELLSGITKKVITNIPDLKDISSDITVTEDFPLEAECVLWIRFSLSKRLENRINDIDADVFLIPWDLHNIDKYQLKDVKLFEVDENGLPSTTKSYEDALRIRNELMAPRVSE